MFHKNTKHLKNNCFIYIHLSHFGKLRQMIEVAEITYNKHCICMYTYI